ncbi:MAG: hypothetical protein ACKPEO_03780 [Sphaerospermopsis kisseleviana]|nr:hypothetical protein [Sphaerospermopsis sp. LEGE 00249]MBC5794697.1 hypothetical protein [Sphaerospermopsis sp. LEGE 00249]
MPVPLIQIKCTTAYSLVIPILYEDALNYITNRKGRKEHKERGQKI